MIYDTANGYYDDNGIWQRTKFCFVQCHNCTCGPPTGHYYSPAHDKNRQPKEPNIRRDDDVRGVDIP